MRLSIHDGEVTVLGSEEPNPLEDLEEL